MRNAFMTILVSLAAMLAMASCRGKNSREEKPSIITRIPYERASLRSDTEQVTKTVITFARQLQDMHHLFLYNSYCIIDEETDTITKVHIDFTSQMSVELCEARKILVDAVEGYMKRLQENPVLNYSFGNGPIEIEELDVHITFESYFNKYVDPTYTAYAILEDGWSYFYDSELNMPFTDIWMQKVEPYYKTKEIVTFMREAEESYRKKTNIKGEKLLEKYRLYLDENNPNIITN